jgi:hypothetical protein
MNDQVNNLIQIRNSLKRGKAGNLAENRAFLDFITIQKQLESEFEATWAVIRERMEQYDIQSIKERRLGSRRLRSLPNLQTEGKVAPRFTKQTLDGSEIRHYMKNHSNQAPKGIKVINSLRFRKNIKGV